MTLPKLDSLGNEQIRVMIAEALGWTRCVGGCQPKGDTTPKYWRKWGKEYRECPSFDTDANAALTLCAWMAEKGWQSFLNNSRGEWNAIFTNNKRQINAPADTLPLAICRAFLIANHLAE